CLGHEGLLPSGSKPLGAHTRNGTTMPLSGTGTGSDGRGTRIGAGLNVYASTVPIFLVSQEATASGKQKRRNEQGPSDQRGGSIMISVSCRPLPTPPAPPPRPARRRPRRCSAESHGSSEAGRKKPERKMRGSKGTD